MAKKSRVTNQTLDRGLRALALIASSPEALSIDDVASRLDIHRSMAYRVIRTLEDHHLSVRDSDGKCRPGHRLAELARGIESPLRSVSKPILQQLASELKLSTFVAVPSGSEVVTLDSADPPRADAVVGYRPGALHPIDRGAPGIAILAGRAYVEGERSEVTQAREQRWARSAGEVVAGLGSLSVWIAGPDGTAIAAIACLYIAEAAPDISPTVKALQAASDRITHLLN